VPRSHGEDPSISSRCFTGEAGSESRLKPPGAAEAPQPLGPLGPHVDFQPVLQGRGRVRIAAEAGGRRLIELG